MSAALVGGVIDAGEPSAEWPAAPGSPSPYPSTVGRVRMSARITIDGNLVADPEYGVSN